MQLQVKNTRTSELVESDTYHQTCPTCRQDEVDFLIY